MASKNNFSKAVMDLMGLPGNEENEEPKKESLEDTFSFEKVNREEHFSEVEKKPEMDKNAFIYAPPKNMSYNQAPIKEEVPATVISRTMVIVGEITSSGDIDAYGDVKGSIKTDGDIKSTGKIIGDIAGNNFNLNGCTVQGNITAKGNVIIGANTVVVGDITADNIKINGKVKGNLKITNMSEFMENALLVGDVAAQTISMNQGAKLHGNVSVALDSSKGEREFESIFKM